MIAELLDPLAAHAVLGGELLERRVVDHFGRNRQGQALDAEGDGGRGVDRQGPVDERHAGSGSAKAGNFDAGIGLGGHVVWWVLECRSCCDWATLPDSTIAIFPESIGFP